MEALASLMLDRETKASERPGDYDDDASLAGRGLFLEHPLAGAIVFELPADVATAHGTLRLALSGEVADSVIVVPVDFAGLEHRAEQALPDVAWANP